MKIRINDCDVKTKPRDADSIVAGEKPEKTLHLDFEIEIPAGTDVQKKLEDILSGVRRVTLEALKTKKLIPEDAKAESAESDVITDRQRELIESRW